MDEIKERLDKIIELLENQMRFQIVDSSAIEGQPVDGSQSFVGNCNCGNHKTGELTGGWYCPVHGQCF